jgi:DNA-binding LacI/PurR family transcriptional regulator
LCSETAQAFGAIRALNEAGLRVPEDISIAAYEDSERARLAGLTVIHTRPEAIAERLLCRINGGEGPLLDYIEPDLIVRQSVTYCGRFNAARIKTVKSNHKTSKSMSFMEK